MQSNFGDSEDQKLLTITENQLYRPSQTCINCTEAGKVKAKNADNTVPSLWNSCLLDFISLLSSRWQSSTWPIKQSCGDPSLYTSLWGLQLYILSQLWTENFIQVNNSNSVSLYFWSVRDNICETEQIRLEKWMWKWPFRSGQDFNDFNGCLLF